MCEHGELHAIPEGLCIGHPEGDCVVLSQHGVVLLTQAGISGSLPWRAVSQLVLTVPTAKFTPPEFLLKWERVKWARRREVDPADVPPPGRVTIIHQGDHPPMGMSITRCQESPRPEMAVTHALAQIYLLVHDPMYRATLGNPSSVAQMLGKA